MLMSAMMMLFMISEVANESEVLDESENQEAGINKPKHPSTPNEAEKRSHDLTHWPYRSWCKICVQCLARDDPHLRQVEQDIIGGLQRVSIDYKELATLKDKKVTALICRDKWSKSLAGFLTSAKGSHDVVEKVVRLIDSLGYRDVEIKSDNENAIMSVRDMAIKRRTRPTV